jgi:hypothetical protein
MDQQFLNSLKNSTPVIQDLQTYMDADDEMLAIAQYIVKHNQHNEYVLPERIKFLYSPKPKKDGGRYSLFDLIKRSEIEKMVNDDFDFILTIFYDVWSKLEPEQKIIQLDKALCGVDMGDGEEVEKLKKKAPDSKEYVSNMYFYGAEKVMRISEVIDLSCASAMEERKEKEKNAKKAKKPVEDQI